MIQIKRLIYQNENGEEITLDFAANNLGRDYIVDRITELMRDMSSGGRDMGPPPRKKPDEPMAWIGGE